MLRIIFLDMDGVLCTYRAHIAQGQGGWKGFLQMGTWPGSPPTRLVPGPFANYDDPVKVPLPQPEPNWRSMYETLDEYNKQCLETIERQRVHIEMLQDIVLKLKDGK